MDLVLQYLYKFDYDDSPSVTETTKDYNADISNNGILSGDQSPTSPVPTSVTAEEQSDFAGQDVELANDSAQDSETEGSMEVSVPPCAFACLFIFPESSLSFF